jgi:hypothetical protein
METGHLYVQIRLVQWAWVAASSRKEETRTLSKHRMPILNLRGVDFIILFRLDTIIVYYIMEQDQP